MTVQESIPEIRLNERYAQLLKSHYESFDKTKDSTPIERRRILSTPSFINKLTEQMSSDSGFLPSNCRYIERTSNGGHMVVIEEPPAYRTIKVNMGLGREVEILSAKGLLEEWNINKKDYNSYKAPFLFNLAFPYVIFILLYDHTNSLMAGQVYLRTAKLIGPSDYLFKAPLLNISRSQYICFGGSANGRTESLSSSVDHTVSIFWSAEFNTDYTFNYDDYKRVGELGYISWQALSQINPMFIYSAPWIKMNNSLMETINNVKINYNVVGSRNISYRELETFFNSPSDTGKIDDSSGIKEKLFYDLTSSIYESEKRNISVGDPIVWGKHIAYPVSFIGSDVSGVVSRVKIQLDNEKTFISKFTDPLRKYLYKKAREMRYQSEGTMKNGVVVKSEDIIKTNINGKYQKVHYIRRSVDGMTEAKVG